MRDPGWLAAAYRDFLFCREVCGGSALSAMVSYGLYPTWLYRYGRAMTKLDSPALRWVLLIPYQLMKVPAELLFGISLARTAEIGVPVMIHHHGGVFVAAGARIGRECQIFQNVVIGESGGHRPGRPTIGDRVIVGVGAKVLGAVAVGDDVRIGANAVVVHDVPARAVAVGIPAVVRSDVS